MSASTVSNSSDMQHFLSPNPSIKRTFRVPNAYGYRKR